MKKPQLTLPKSLLKKKSTLGDLEINVKKVGRQGKKGLLLPWRKASAGSKDSGDVPVSSDSKEEDETSGESLLSKFGFTSKEKPDRTIEEILKEYDDLKTVPLPDLLPEEKEWVVDRYWLKAPFSYAKIVLNWEHDLTYMIVEPKIDEKELIVLEETYEYLRSVLVYDSPKMKDEMTLDLRFARRAVRSFYPEIPDERVEILLYYLQRNFLGYSKLDPLMNDENIEDITCNGAGVPLFIFHRKYSNLETNLIFDDLELNKYVLKLAQKADKQLSLTTPLIDAALPTGARAQITYSDIVSSKGSSFTIRKFKSDPMTPVDLISIGVRPPQTVPPVSIRELQVIRLFLRQPVIPRLYSHLRIISRIRSISVSVTLRLTVSTNSVNPISSSDLIYMIRNTDSVKVQSFTSPLFTSPVTPQFSIRMWWW